VDHPSNPVPTTAAETMGERGRRPHPRSRARAPASRPGAEAPHRPVRLQQPGRASSGADAGWPVPPPQGSLPRSRSPSPLLPLCAALAVTGPQRAPTSVSISSWTVPCRMPRSRSGWASRSHRPGAGWPADRRVAAGRRRSGRARARSARAITQPVARVGSASMSERGGASRELSGLRDLRRSTDRGRRPSPGPCLSLPAFE